MEAKKADAGLSDKAKQKIPEDLQDLFEYATVEFQAFPFIAGRLKFYKDKWLKLDPYVADQYIAGVKLKFKSGIPLRPRHLKQHQFADEEEEKTMDDLLDQCAQKGILQCVFIEGLVSPVFFVKKPPLPDGSPGGFRTIFNLKFLNAHLEEPAHFKMDSLKIVKELARKTDVAITVDLKGAYEAVAMHESALPYMQLQYRANLALYASLPFGLSHAPRVFTSILKPVMTILRSKGYRLAVYVDDIILLASPRLIREQRRDLLYTLISFGFLINWEKSQLLPSKTPTFLGAVVDLEAMCFRVPPEKQKKYRKACQRLLALAMDLANNCPKAVPLKELRQVCGQLNSLSLMVYLCRANTNGLFTDLQRAQRNHLTELKLSNDALEDLNVWMCWFQELDGHVMHVANPDHTVSSDSSSHAYGGGTRKPDGQMLAISRQWPPELSTKHINELELLAAIDVVKSCTTTLDWKKCTVRLLIDNTCAKAYLQRQGGRMARLSKVAGQFHNWLKERDIVLVCEWIASKRNIFADVLSRAEADKEDRMLNPLLFKKLCQVWGRPILDCFATRFNRQLPKFVSRFPDHEAVGFDFFKLCKVDEGLLYGNPPFSLLIRVLAHVQSFGLQMVLILPFWPSSPWWPLLMDLLTTPPLLLPQITSLYIQRQGAAPHQQSHPKWLTLAVQVDGNPVRRSKALQKLWPNPFQSWNSFSQSTRTRQEQTILLMCGSSCPSSEFTKQWLSLRAWTQQAAQWKISSRSSTVSD